MIRPCFHKLILSSTLQAKQLVSSFSLLKFFFLKKKLWVFCFSLIVLDCSLVLVLLWSLRKLGVWNPDGKLETFLLFLEDFADPLRRGNWILQIPTLWVFYFSFFLWVGQNLKGETLVYLYAEISKAKDDD